jgi:hypothetical protein
MRIFMTVVAATTLLGASQAAASEEPSQPAPAAPPSVMPGPLSHTDSKEVVCKREDRTGSRLGGAKVCHTRQEWADMAAAARNSMEGAQRSSMTGLVPGH